MRQKSAVPIYVEPKGAPTRGADIIEARSLLELSTADADWLFGTTSLHWRRYRLKESDPVQTSDIPIALLIRYLRKHPERTIVPEIPHPGHIYKIFARAHEIMNSNFTLAEFGLGLGRQATAGHRWVSGGSDLSSILAHVFVILARQIETVIGRGNIPRYATEEPHLDVGAASAICAIWREWWEVVHEEATARGLPENFHRLRLPWGKTRRTTRKKKSTSDGSEAGEP